ncbi:MAG: hypothetical protein PHS54_00505 [Clostridia bacterium]|nr:hypothetical protein [Clostridia bacterium]
MNLKKLNEKAQWNKLPDSTFKSNIIDVILEQNEKTEKLQNIIVRLEEELHAIKQQLKITNLKNIRLNQNLKQVQGNSNDINIEQKRDNRTVFKSFK